MTIIPVTVFGIIGVFLALVAARIFIHPKLAAVSQAMDFDRVWFGWVEIEIVEFYAASSVLIPTPRYLAQVNVFVTSNVFASLDWVSAVIIRECCEIPAADKTDHKQKCRQ